MDFFEPIEFLQLKKREDFLDYLPHYSFCIKLGCYSGVFSQHIITKTHPKKFYLVDSYRKFNSETIYSICGIEELDKENCVIFVVDNENFISDMKNGIFDWVYVDTIFEYNRMLLELNLLKKKIKREGWICGYNYIQNRDDKNFGICRAITEWLYNNEDFELYMLDNHTQWAIRRKIRNENFSVQ